MNLRAGDIVAVCAGGLEPILVRECRDLGCPAEKLASGRVLVQGGRASRERTVRLFARLRTASELDWVVAPLDGIRGRDDLYRAARAAPWERWVRPDTPIRVDAAVRATDGFDHAGFAGLVVKDALCDRLRETAGARPDVRPDDAKVVVAVDLAEGHGYIGLRANAQCLHKRGLRTIDHAAPLKETLAAAVVLAAGLPERGPLTLLDPVCGSGTLLTEGGLAALGLPPGRRSPVWFKAPEADENLVPAFQAALAERGPRPKAELSLVGADIDSKAVAATAQHLTAAELADRAVVLTCDVRTNYADVLARVPAAGALVVLANPPYGERIGERRDALAVHRAVIDGTLAFGRGRADPTLLAMLTPLSDDDLGVRPLRTQRMRNGALECRLVVYRVDPRRLSGGRA